MRMLLEKLALNNFKRFREAEIHFQDGITGIVGNNGTGKSSIVEAILFALYGVKGSGVNSDYIISSFAGPHEFCEVRLDFSLSGCEYTVYRKFKKGSHDASLFFRPGGSDEPHKELAKSVNEVGSCVQDIIGMGPADFRNTIYAGQKDLLSLLDYQPHARREWFGKALGIDYLKNRSDEILKEGIDETESRLRLQRARMETLAVEAEQGKLDEFREKEADLARKEVEVTGARTRYAAIRERLLELSTSEQALLAAKERLSAEERALESLEADRIRLQSLDEPLERYKEIERELGDLRGNEPIFRELSAQIRVLDSQVKQKSSRWHDVMEELDKLVTEKDELAGLSGTQAELEAKREQDRRMVEARLLTGALDEINASVVLLQKREKEWTDRIRAQEEIIARFLGSGDEAARLERDREESLQRVAALMSRFEAIRDQRAALGTDFERIRKAGPSGTCPLCHQRLGDHFGRLDQEFADRGEQLAQAERQAAALLEQAKGEDKELERRLSDLRSGLRKLEEARITLTDITARKSQDHTALEKMRRDLDEKQRDLDRLGTGRYDLQSHHEIQARIKTLEGTGKKVEQLKAHLAREPDLEKERDRLVIETTEDHAALEDRKKRLQETRYDEEKRKGLERELARLMPVRDESIGIRDRLSRETGILARRDQARTGYDLLTGETARIRDCLAGIGWTGESFETIQASLDAIDDELRQCSAGKALVHERIVRLELVLSQMKTCREETDRLEDMLELQKITRKTVAEYIVYLMQVVRSRIEGDVGRILSDITAGRYDRVLIDDDFGLLIRDIDNDYPVERFSGGEQDDIAVALRIALSRYLATLHQVPEPTFLIFDEIFGSQDEERRNNLLFALRSIESHFPQILLISHIPELQGEFAHTLLIELGSDQVSRIQEVNQ
jgi:exonuclease SbcC